MATPPKELTEKERWLAERYSRGGERDVSFETISGEPVEPLYTRDDLRPDADADNGLPC